MNKMQVKLTLMHPTCGTTLTEQPFCQYCAEPFKDVLLHKDKFLSQCNHAYCLKCFHELLHLKKNCTICNAEMKYKSRPSQEENTRFHAKSKVRSSYSLHLGTQGKLKMFKVGQMPPFPLVGNQVQYNININRKQDNHLLPVNNDKVITPIKIMKENDNTCYSNTNLFDDYGSSIIYRV